MQTLKVLWHMGFGLPPGSSWYKVLTDWGGLIGGAAALVAGLIAYGAARGQVRATERAIKTQLDADKEKAALEVEILRRSLAVELRQMIGHALAAHIQSAHLVLEHQGAVTSRMLEDSCAPFHPLIYPTVAGRVASLGDDAMDVAIFYNTNAIARDYIARLTRSREPDNLNRISIAAVTEIFMNACKQGCALLERLPTSMSTHIETDAKFNLQVKEAELRWPGVMNLIKARTEEPSKSPRQ